MPIAVPYGNEYYYTDEFKSIVRSCKEILLAQASFSPFIDRSVAFAYRYNFHKFLRSLKQKDSDAPAIDEDMIWVVSFINGIEDPSADFSNLPGIYVVNHDIIDKIIRINRVKRE